MPKNHRDKLEEHGIKELVVTVDKTAGCLLIYPPPIFDELEEKVMALANHDDAAREAQRRFVGHATELELDGTGRMLLPAELRDYAGIGRKAFLIGQGKKFELWEERAWEAECDKWKHKGASAAEAPAELLNISF